eukprot:CAMPEP_0116948668 /NCGR_PEP_ID=MMETSP0467-20121206/38466_1 /TAXON_ID=283647 /ORGANISM="Mesodinium pulex, Strain SPMC105" /LENGTH=140 /DNA_ID=CAMNT_0004633177 /DNA_START=78 /DNA_END=500 /DNA_ORIENTATION=+
MDINGDGQIDKYEFGAFIKRAFELLDADIVMRSKKLWEEQSQRTFLDQIGQFGNEQKQGTKMHKTRKQIAEEEKLRDREADNMLQEVMEKVDSMVSLKPSNNGSLFKSLSQKYSSKLLQNSIHSQIRSESLMKPSVDSSI